MNAGQGEMEVTLDSNKEEIQARKEEMKEEMKTGEEEMKATVSAILQGKNSSQYDTKACLEKREEIAEGIKVITKRHEVLNEGTEMENIGAMEDPYGERHLALWLSRHPLAVPTEVGCQPWMASLQCHPSTTQEFSSRRPGDTLGNDSGGRSRRQQLSGKQQDVL
jgi:hypothetical protein